jgi:putative glycosyltransferase (TIGR04372 family)
MSLSGILIFTKRQINHILKGGLKVLFIKIKLTIKLIFPLPVYTYAFLIPAIPIVIGLRILKPLLLIRIGDIYCSRIGQLAAVTELYLCERDAGINKPKQRHVDLFYLRSRPVCNFQLMKMVKPLLHIWPAWFLAPVARVNRLIPGGDCHEVGVNTLHDRDVHNLYDRFPAHLKFTEEEELRGKNNLLLMGIKPDNKFICLNVRDSAYIDSLTGGDGENSYRNSDVQSYVLASQELVSRGYFVIRMGANVNKVMDAKNEMIIDYATNGMRTDFMDIYLGSKCLFCISTGTGFDAVPVIFRRPMLYVNLVPLGFMPTWREPYICITRHHFLATENRNLTLSEIFSFGAGFCDYSSDYKNRGIILVDNTPEEIRDVTVEMIDRLNGLWQYQADDDILQESFWKIYSKIALHRKTNNFNFENGILRRYIKILIIEALDKDLNWPLHGEIRSRFGADFLRNNRKWIN